MPAESRPNLNAANNLLLMQAESHPPHISAAPHPAFISQVKSLAHQASGPQLAKPLLFGQPAATPSSSQVPPVEKLPRSQPVRLANDHHTAKPASKQHVDELPASQLAPLPGAHSLHTGANTHFAPLPPHIHRAAEQIGRVTTINQLRDGQFEFKLTLPTGSLAGAQIYLTTTCANRINLRLIKGKAPLDSESLSALVEQMTRSGLTIGTVQIA